MYDNKHSHTMKMSDVMDMANPKKKSSKKKMAGIRRPYRKPSKEKSNESGSKNKSYSS